MIRELTVHLGSADGRLWASTEFLSAMLGSLTGGVIGGGLALLGTWLANKNARELADEAAKHNRELATEAAGEARTERLAAETFTRQLAKQSEEDRNNAEAWRLIHAYTLMTGVIGGIHGKLVAQLEQIQKDIGFVPDDRLWIFLKAGSLPPCPQALTADQYSALIKVGRADLLNELLGIESDMHAVRNVITTYTTARGSLLTQHQHHIVRGVTNDSLIGLDLQFIDLIALAPIVVSKAGSAFDRMHDFSPKFFEAMTPYAEAMGLTLSMPDLQKVETGDI